MNITNSMKLTISAKSQNESFARSAVAAFCIPLNPSIEELDDIKTAVSEAVTNSIVHGYKSQQDGTIEISCNIFDNGTVSIAVTDYGEGIFDVTKAMEPFYTTVSTGERSGMGFTVMKAFCDDVEVRSNLGKTCVTLTKKFSQAVAE